MRLVEYLVEYPVRAVAVPQGNLGPYLVQGFFHRRFRRDGRVERVIVNNYIQTGRFCAVDGTIEKLEKQRIDGKVGSPRGHGVQIDGKADYFNTERLECSEVFRTMAVHQNLPGGGNLEPGGKIHPFGKGHLRNPVFCLCRLV